MLTVSKDDWLRSFSKIIYSSVENKINSREECSVMLTGGRAAELLYQYWAEHFPWKHDKITYYFGDERAVSPDHQDSNYAMVMRTLFPVGKPSSCRVERIEGEARERNAEAGRYEKILPPSIDVLLLSVGPDGHIASLFPGEGLLQETERLVVPVIGSKLPRHRFTITPNVIRSAKTVFLLAIGAEKGRVLAEALRQPEDVFSLPVRLTIGCTWLLDQDAIEQFRKSNHDYGDEIRIEYV